MNQILTNPVSKFQLACRFIFQFQIQKQRRVIWLNTFTQFKRKINYFSVPSVVLSFVCWHKHGKRSIEAITNSLQIYETHTIRVHVVTAPETCVLCTTVLQVLWVVNVESVMTPIHGRIHVHNLQSGPSNCCNNTNQMWQTSSVFKVSWQVWRGQRSQRNNGYQILSSALQTRREVVEESTRLWQQLMPMSCVVRECGRKALVETLCWSSEVVFVEWSCVGLVIRS